MNIVIQQPLFFPWFGFIDLVKNADILVFYDDVQLPTKSTFINRVQIKTSNGILWLSPPINRSYSKHNNINESYYISDNKWRINHIKTLERNYKKTKYYKEMMNIAEDVYNYTSNNISNFNIYCCTKLLKYFNYFGKIIKSSDINVIGKSTERLVNICKKLGANHYITAHGAKNYLEHEKFEYNSIKVSYIDYKYNEWNQLYGNFTKPRFSARQNIILHFNAVAVAIYNKPSLFSMVVISYRQKPLNF